MALIVWGVLFIPWFIPGLMAAGMAFEGKPNLAAVYTFEWLFWSYPVAVMVASLFHRKYPVLVLLPLLNVVGSFVALDLA